MKAELEPKELQYRGISVISETEEEKQVLINLWNQKGVAPTLGGLVRDGYLMKLGTRPTKYRLPAKVKINVEGK